MVPVSAPLRAPSGRSDREISTVGQVRVGLVSLSLRPDGDVPAIRAHHRVTMPRYQAVGAYDKVGESMSKGPRGSTCGRAGSGVCSRHMRGVRFETRETRVTYARLAA